MPTKASKHDTPVAVGNSRLPGWPSVAALFAVAILYLLLSRDLTRVPTWLLSGALGLMVVAALIAELQGAHHLRRRLVMGTNAFVTASLVAGAGSLVYQLSLRGDNPLALLRDAILLWTLTAIAFALWYWELDNGGPMHRSRLQYQATDFVFPQLQGNPPEVWTPTFIDYLFLAFNTNTAFSPTDTLVLSRPAKLLMMVQSSIALIDVVVIAARAVGTLRL